MQAAGEMVLPQTLRQGRHNLHLRPAQARRQAPGITGAPTQLLRGQAAGDVPMKGAVILSLCDYTGNWSAPYAEAGYDVRRVDLQHGQDVRLLEHLRLPVHGILAAPPCTAFSKAGAWKWKEKGTAGLLEGLALVDACLRAVAIYRPVWWALENPAGRLRRWLGKPAWSFQPCNFGDPWTKRTFLWGCFTPPTPLFSEQARQAVEPLALPGAPGSNDYTTRLNSKDVRRSATPPGFAKAFFECNP